jgi:hypothetical protein
MEVAKDIVRLAIGAGGGGRLTVIGVVSVIPAEAGIQSLDPGSSPGRRSHSPKSDENFGNCCTKIGPT